MRSRWAWIIAGVAVFIGVWVGLSLGLVWLLSADEDDPTPSTATETLPPGVDAIMVDPIRPATLPPNPAETPVLPAETLEAILQDITDLEGVTEICAATLRPFQAGWLVYLEVITERGYVNSDTATAIYTAAFAYLDAPQASQVNIVLWDRVNRAINHTWNASSQTWLNTQIVSNPC